MLLCVQIHIEQCIRGCRQRNRLADYISNARPLRKLVTLWAPLSALFVPVLVGWIIMLVVWYLLGLPVGPDSAIRLANMVNVPVFTIKVFDIVADALR